MLKKHEKHEILISIWMHEEHQVISTIADYLEVWYVPSTDMELNLLRGYVDVRGLDEELQDQENDFDQSKKIIKPPPWSVLHDWKPPHTSDILYVVTDH